MKTGVLILVDELKSAGAENLAVNIAIGLKGSGEYTPVVCATRAGGASEERLKRHCIEYLVLQRQHSYEIHKFSCLSRLIHDHHIKIIHAHKTGSSFWGGLAGTWNGVEAVFAHVHGKALDWKTFLTERFFGRLCDRIIAVSEFERQRLIQKQGISAGKVVTIYNGINPVKYVKASGLATKNRLALPVGTRVVGISAELRLEKRHEVFLRAAREVLRITQDVCFLIIGDGARRAELEQLAFDLEISRHCVFTGFVREVENFLAAIDIGILCSEREALPLTLLEYMASGKPVVATNIGGVPEVIQDGVNGYLVPTGDYQALAQRINLLLAEQDLAARMGENGRSIVEQRFAEHKMMQQIESLYAETLTHKKSVQG